MSWWQQCKHKWMFVSTSEKSCKSSGGYFVHLLGINTTYQCDYCKEYKTVTRPPTPDEIRIFAHNMARLGWPWAPK